MNRFGFLLCIALALPCLTRAATMVPDSITFSRAVVVHVASSTEERTMGVTRATQDIEARVLEGDEKEKTIAFNNDFTQLKTGDTFYLRRMTDTLNGTSIYSVADTYRLPVLVSLAVLFVALAVYFGGMQGARGLMSMLGSLVIIFYVLLPGILSGFSPTIVTIGVASLIIIVGSYITHGFNRTTSAAVVGMIMTVIITGVLAYVSVHSAQLTGFVSDDSANLVYDSRGKIDLVGLLFGGIMIGLLGVLYDIAIGQAIAVEELKSAGAHLSSGEIYRKAIRIGREHIGALINTLAIAYVGSSLTLLLLIHSSTGSILFMLNSEVFATEVIRILIGSIGIILAVPITTIIAVYMVCGSAHGAHPHEHSHSHTHGSEQH